MKMFKYITFFFFVSFLLNACDVTYKKNNIKQDLEKVLKKEYDQNSKAYITGKTVYLDIEFSELSLKNKAAVFQAMHKIKSAVFVITRIVLSSDSDIKYLIATLYNCDNTLAFRIVKNIDDIKSYHCGRISNSDFNSRNVFEIEWQPTTERIIADKHDITDNEYFGRLIASRINTFLINSPIPNTFYMHYSDVINKTLMLSSSGIIDNMLIPIAEMILQEETEIYSKKYNMFFQGVKVFNSQGKIMLNISN
jgi:hypothetical protein